MEYRYPPLYKYIIIFVIVFLFLRYYNYITPDKYLWIALFVTILIILLDYMIISDHPNVMHNREDELFDELAEILDFNDSDNNSDNNSDKDNSDNDSDSDSDSED